MKQDIFYADMHCDTLTELELSGEGLADNSLHVSLKKARDYAFYCQVMAVWTPDELQDEARFLNLLSKRRLLERELAVSPELHFCKCFQDLKQAFETKKTAVFLALEGAGALDGKAENLEKAYEMGVRFITLTWNGSNELADGVLSDSTQGLTPFGKQMLTRMEELSILPDVSHLSEKAFWQLCDCTKKPFVATHSNAKKICSHPRNLTDEQLLTMKKRGNLIGINIYPPFLTEDVQSCTVYDIIKHIDHMLSLGLSDQIAFGCDFDGIGSLPKGIKDVSDIASLYELFLRHGYSEELINNIFFWNFYRFIEKVLP